MGPIALFDKSFLQSLSVDEAVFFDHFFMPVICPIFYVETLADLQKAVREGRTPEQEVGIIADKVPEMSGGPCAYHVKLGAASLFGAGIPLDGRIPTAGGRPVRIDGKSGFVHEEPPEAQAFRRWQNREFLTVERQFAAAWRATLNNINLRKIAAGVRAMGIKPGARFKSLQDVRTLVNEFVAKDGSTGVDQLNLALAILGIPPEYDLHLFRRWAREGRLSISRFAAYTAHMISVELFFQIALGAALIGTADANNRTDIGYLFYSPFCQVFVSSDKLHRRCAPLFLRPDQSFVWGHALKADLNRLRARYNERPEEEKEKGLFQLAPTPPPSDHESLVGQLWDRHLSPSWRERARSAPQRHRQNNAELIAHINRLSSAPSLAPEHVDFDPDAADFIQIQRRVSKRRGSIWQLPKNVET